MYQKAKAKVLIAQINLDDPTQLKELLQLQKASYTVEAELIGSYEIPPLKDTLESLQNCAETFYGYFSDGILSGAVSFKKSDGSLDIHRMVVSPAYFRRGIASQLLNFILTEAAKNKVAKVVVSTGAQNEPAKKLYQRFGFSEIAQREVIPGLFISQFEKLIAQE